MLFLHAIYLLGLIAIVIPVIIHLFNFRRYKKEYFSNVSFIEEIQLKTKKQSQLRHIIVMILRMLVLAALVFAFANPYIPVKVNTINTAGKNLVSIYIDNSFSMEANTGNGRLIDAAKNKALEIASVFSNADLFQLVTNDFEGKNQRFVSKDEFEQVVKNTDISPAFRNIDEVLKLQNDLFSQYNSKSKKAFLVSDFRNNVPDKISTTNIDSSLSVFIVPLKSNEYNNIYIDSCWFERPFQQTGKSLLLKVLVKNASLMEYEKIPLKLMVNNRQKALSSFDLKPGGSKEISLSYSHNDTGFQKAVLEINDAPVTFDDKLYFSYTVNKFIHILYVFDKQVNKYFRLAFSVDSSFNYLEQSIGKLDMSSFPVTDLMIIDGIEDFSSGFTQEIINFLNTGGSLIVIPSYKADISNYNTFLTAVNANTIVSADTFKTKISEINLNHAVYRDVFEKIPENMELPLVFYHYRLNRTSRSLSEMLLKLQNSDDFLELSRLNKGNVYLFASPLDTRYTDFVKQAVFIPTLFKIAFLSRAENKLYYQIGVNEPIGLRQMALPKSEVLKLKKDNGNFEFIPELRRNDSRISLFCNNQVKEAGNYSVLNGSEEILPVSFNYNRKESPAGSYDPVIIEKTLAAAGFHNITFIDKTDKPIAGEIKMLMEGKALWKLFILLTLICLAAEVVLLRIWKP